MKSSVIVFLSLFLLCHAVSCQNPASAGAEDQTRLENVEKPAQSWNPVDTSGKTVAARFTPPEGFARISSPEPSFASYLQHLPLKSHGTEVKYFDGRTKVNREVYLAVVDLDVGARDLQQCADAVMRLRAEYLWGRQAYDDIHFNFTNGFRVDYAKYRQGYRVKINGNQTSWQAGAQPSGTYRTFRNYLDLVFAYAGTLSLAKELVPVEVSQMQIGDVFIRGGSPGHAVIVVDMAENPATGQKLFMLAQSYMPAQDIQILQNPQQTDWSPWYPLEFGDTLYTPEWTFQATDLKRFAD